MWAKISEKTIHLDLIKLLAQNTDMRVEYVPSTENDTIKQIRNTEIKGAFNPIPYGLKINCFPFGIWPKTRKS